MGKRHDNTFVLNHNLKKILKTFDETLKFDYSTADLTLDYHEDIHWLLLQVAYVCKRKPRKVSWFDLKTIFICGCLD